MEHVVAELAQLLPRTGALPPQPDGGDDPPDCRQRRDRSRLSATRQVSHECHKRRRP
jgi:hypothetical protein